MNWGGGEYNHSVHGRGGGRISKKRGQHVLKHKNGTFKVLHIILSGCTLFSVAAHYSQWLQQWVWEYGLFGSDREKPICYCKGIDLPFWFPWAKSFKKAEEVVWSRPWKASMLLQRCRLTLLVPMSKIFHPRETFYFMPRTILFHLTFT